MDNATCSVIVPVKNSSEGKIRVGNWLTSDYSKQIEVIIVQDCVDSFAGAELRFLFESWGLDNLKYVEGNFGNPGSARNAGLQSVTGDWFAFWDADDLPDVCKFLDSLSKAQAGATEVMIGSFQIGSHSTERIISVHEISASTDLLKEITLRPGLWRFAFKTKDFGHLRFPASSMGEDQVFISAISIFDHKIYRTNENIYTYFTGVPGQVTSNHGLMRDMRVSIKQLQSLLLEQSGYSQKITISFICKQNLTCIKRGSIQLKITAFMSLFLLLIGKTSDSFQAIRLIRQANS